MGLYRRNDCSCWWLSIRINGRRVRESTGKTVKKAAAIVYANRLSELSSRRGLPVAPAVRRSFQELVDVYKADYMPKLKHTERVETIIKHLTAFFGAETSLEDIGDAVGGYEAYRSKAKRPPVPGTLLRELGVLRRMFSVAKKKLRWISENPVDRIDLPSVNDARVRFLAPGELQTLMVALPGWIRPIVTLARHTGLRRSNLLNLTWADVDLKGRVLFVLRTKNEKALGMPLTRTAVEVLEGVGRVRHLSSPFVFCDDEGNPHKGYRVSKTFERSCKKAGIENLRFHDLRHDFASCLVQSGIDLNKVRELLGHKDLRMTQRYAHLEVEHLRGAVDVLDVAEQVTFWSR